MTNTETNDQNRGLYRRFDLYRVGDDGKPQYLVTDPYFILRYTTDPHARVALEAYADACEEEHPALAADLRSAKPQVRELAVPVDDAESLLMQYSEWLDVEKNNPADPDDGHTNMDLVRLFISQRSPHARPPINRPNAHD